jgi:hypothetical protein
MNWKGSIYPMLDSIKNSLIGKLHHPHNHFMAKGCHAITLATHVRDSKFTYTQKERTRDFLAIIEKLVRISD